MSRLEVAEICAVGRLPSVGTFHPDAGRLCRGYLIVQSEVRPYEIVMEPQPQLMIIYWWMAFTNR